MRAVADSWIFQGGYPLVSVALSADGRRLRLTQEPFRYLAEAGCPTTIWKVPVLARVHRQGGEPTGGDLVRVLLDGPETTVELDPPADSVLLVNAGGHGFYRVRYSDALLGALTARAQDQLAPIERYALVDDTYAAMLAGRTTSAAFLALARGLADDDDLSVWQRLAAALGALSRLLDGDELVAYRGVVRDLAGPALDITGWEPAEGDSDRRRELRATLFTLLGTVGRGSPGASSEPASCTRRPCATDGDEVDPSLARGGAERGGRRTADPRSTNASPGGPPRPPTPRSSGATSTAWPTSAGDELIDRTLRALPDGGHPHPGRPLRGGPGPAEPVPGPPGVGLRGPPLGRAERALPVQHDRAHAGPARPPSPGPTWPTRWRRSSPSTPSPRGPRRWPSTSRSCG